MKGIDIVRRGADNGVATFTYDVNGNVITDSGSNPSVNIVIADPASLNTIANRYTQVTATWPGDDTFSVRWTYEITKYRLLVTGGATGDYVKVCEDAVNETQAEAWLANPTPSETAEVNHYRAYTSTQAASTSFFPLYTEWRYFAEGYGINRLDFLASVAGPLTIFVEAE